ncbi:MAG: 1-acyl-sn-glycerol-3-phosphate acyltransferase [Spirochaetia bacterium]|nr:1-acyl-sn-glycerol-3-phosphate acyltransferase [Spirochaetia bacterium]
MKKHQQTDREIATSMSFVRFVKSTYGIPVRRMYNITTANEAPVFGLKPPYILLSNHVNTLDPILISLMHNRHIHWVAADTLFRNRYLRFLLRRMIGTISKTKSRSDYYTIKQITKTVRRGGVVGLFPEGQRTWDGRSLPLFYATAKLVRMLKVPVVLCTLEGGYHTLPRWSPKRRRGKMVLAYQDPIMPEEFSSMKVQEIHEMLYNRLYHDADEYQRSHKIIYASDRRAEHVEHVLYLCPSCGAAGLLSSHGNDLTCSACGYTAHMDIYGFFQYPEGIEGFPTVADWNSWQHEELKRRVLSAWWKPEEAIFPEDRARMFSGYRDSRMKVLGTVGVRMSTRGIEVIRPEGVTLFKLEEIESLAVALQRNLEFYYEKRMYRLHFPDQRTSAYKYLAVYEAIVSAGKDDSLTAITV